MPTPLNSPSSDPAYRVRFRRGGHHWTFVFRPDDASRVLERVSELGADDACPLTPHDARRLAAHIERVIDPALSQG